MDKEDSFGVCNSFSSNNLPVCCTKLVAIAAGMKFSLAPSERGAADISSLGRGKVGQFFPVRGSNEEERKGGTKTEDRNLLCPLPWGEREEGRKE